MKAAEVHVKQREVSRIALQYGLDLVVLFGSRAEGRAGPGSDIDLAVRKTGSRSLDDWEDETDDDLALIGELVSAVQAKDGDVDVVFLDRASPLLQFHVARHGKLLYEAGPLVFTRFKSYAARLFDDSRKFYEAQRRYLTSEFGHGG